MSGLEDRIKAEAFALGFSLAGICLPERPEHYDVYTQAAESGQFAGMSYLSDRDAVEKRSHPALFFPPVRSILMLGTGYPISPHDSAEMGRGKIAAYATLQEDYHTFLIQRMQALTIRIAEMVSRSFQFKICTDTGPFLEREFAVKAGLGWIGKNTNFIAPQQGSGFLLSEILLDLHLEPDEPFSADHCGTCRRCIEACPTGCIREDRTLDTGRCIAYLTIENKGAIPIELRSRIGDRVFGCDVCQSVCPHNNRFSPRRCEPRKLDDPLLQTEIQLTPQEFNRKYRSTPVARAKRRGFLRNLAVALGNSRDPACIPVLRQVVQNEPEPLVRAHAAWALHRLGGRAEHPFLAMQLAQETDPDVRSEISELLSTDTTSS